MDLEDTMRAIKAEVDGALGEFFQKKRKEAQQIHPGLVELVDQITDVTLRGGKRIRPFLCWLGYCAVAQEIPRLALLARDDIKNAMLGLELFQTFAIIHDDIMDESTSRRGSPSVHEHFHVTCHLSPVTRARRVGESMAILAGDLALMWADEAMHNAKCQMLNAKWNAMKEEVAYGQTLDVALKVKPFEPKRFNLLKQKADELKTAWYSVVRPLQIGSSLASGNDSIMQLWERYGVAVGKLFQLRDDLLDGELSEEAFAAEAKPLRERALNALKELEASEEAKQLLADFVAFVQNRNS